MRGSSRHRFSRSNKLVAGDSSPKKERGKSRIILSLKLKEMGRAEEGSDERKGGQKIDQGSLQGSCEERKWLAKEGEPYGGKPGGRKHFVLRRGIEKTTPQKDRKQELHE